VQVWPVKVWAVQDSVSCVLPFFFPDISLNEKHWQERGAH
jgi:hypothetical protein